MKRKVLSLILAFCLLLTLVPARAQAKSSDVRIHDGLAVADAAPGMVSRVAQNPVTPTGNNELNVYYTDGGTVSVEIKQEDDWDQFAYVTAKPDKGYVFYGMEAVALSGDDAPYITYAGNYTFKVLLPYGADVDIYVYFSEPEGEQHELTLEITDKEGGTVTMSKTRAYAGEQVFVDLEFNPHYSRAYVSFQGAWGYGIMDYDHSEEHHELLMPDCDVIVSVRFLADPTISLSCYSYGGGTIALDRTDGYEGDTFRCTILPNPGYRINYIYAQDFTGILPLKYVGGNQWEGTIREDAGHVGIDVTFAESEHPFLDVPDDAFYYDPVMWALEEGITTGTDMSHFDPNGTCLRAHVVTFLWRAAGCPEPTTTVNPFSDVSESDFFCKAVLWAVENGITNGVSETAFGPYLQCNRAQVVTFLWRFRGSPAAGETVNPFTDVEEREWYADAVLWAVANGITNGLSETEFGVTTACNRAQIVTFLYRLDQLPEPEPEPEPEIPTEPTDPTEPEVPTDPTDPSQPAKTYTLDLRTNGNGEVSYVDNIDAAPGESIFFYAVPNPGFYLDHVGIFNPDNTIDVSMIQIIEHGNDLYELIMIPFDIIMTCHFYPNP